MRKVALVLVWIVVAAGEAQAANPSLTAGGGGMNVPPNDRDAMWSEPPNLDGLLATSEVIGSYGLETEVANDFVLPNDCYLGIARWWGGYYNNYGCSDSGVATYWNLRFYMDGGCEPSSVFVEYLAVLGYETYVYCQSSEFPIFRYHAHSGTGWINGNIRYWFSAQAADHGFPPQCARLASAEVIGCDSVFKAAYFGYPDWTPAIDVFGVPFDASQEFEAVGIDEHGGACCLNEQGDCRMVWDEEECTYLGGEWLGINVGCDEDPCGSSPVRDTSWGQIKNLYR